VNYRYKDKYYCYAVIREFNAEELEKKNKTVSSKMSKFGKGFKIPDDKFHRSDY
jgi:hypothetical protein